MPPLEIPAFDLNKLRKPPAPSRSEIRVEVREFAEGLRVAITFGTDHGLFADALDALAARQIGNGLLQLANVIDPPGLTTKQPIFGEKVDPS